jgi:DNA processing protein
MITPLTSNTQAILLLTAPLIAGRNDSSAELLTFGEYNRLARLLREKQKQPADLIGSTASEVIDCARRCLAGTAGYACWDAASC